MRPDTDYPETDLPLTLRAMHSAGLPVSRIFTRDPLHAEHGEAPRHAFVEWFRKPNQLELRLAEHLTGGAMQITPKVVA